MIKKEMEFDSEEFLPPGIEKVSKIQYGTCLLRIGELDLENFNYEDIKIIPDFKIYCIIFLSVTKFYGQ